MVQHARLPATRRARAPSLTVAAWIRQQAAPLSHAAPRILAAPLPADQPSLPGSPAGRGAGAGGLAGDEEAQTAPSAQPKRASRWTAEEAAGSEGQQLAAAGAAAEEQAAQRGVGTGLHAEQQGDEMGAEEGDPDELSPRHV